MNIAVPPLPELASPLSCAEDDKNDNLDTMENLDRYRHSIISIPRVSGVSGFHRGSIVTSHLDIAPKVVYTLGYYIMHSIRHCIPPRS